MPVLDAPCFGCYIVVSYFEHPLCYVRGGVLFKASSSTQMLKRVIETLLHQMHFWSRARRRWLPVSYHPLLLLR